MGKLTDLRIKKIKSTEKNAKYADGGGLYLLVTPKGARYWRFKYTFEGKERTLSIGVYPVVSLIDARLKHLEAKKLLEQKIDPSANKQKEKKDKEKAQPFSAIVANFLVNESVKHKGHKWEKNKLNKILRDFPELANKSINAINESDIIKFRNKRETQIQGTSVKRELQILGSVFSYAIRELLLIEHSPLRKVAKPKDNPHRETRVNLNEVEILLKAFNFTSETPVILKKHQVAWAFLFALETAMRLSEIANMRWENIFDQYVLLPETKNGTSRKVPLNINALELLTKVKGLDEEKVLTISADSLSTTFRKFRDTTELGHIHFHDTRHEACTKYAQYLSVQDLAKVTGHKDLGMLMRYYNPTPEELANKMNKKINSV